MCEVAKFSESSTKSYLLCYRIIGFAYRYGLDLRIGSSSKGGKRHCREPSLGKSDPSLSNLFITWCSFTSSTVSSCGRHDFVNRGLSPGHENISWTGLSACSGSLDSSFLGSALGSWTSSRYDGISADFAATTGSSEITDSSTFSTASDLNHKLPHGKLSSIRYIPVNSMKYKQNVPHCHPRGVITGNSVGKRNRVRLNLVERR